MRALQDIADDLEREVGESSQPGDGIEFAYVLVPMDLISETIDALRAAKVSA